ncbi:hypothetical protein DXV75_09495 [Alteromonas aestuariivivens]|uniref:Uncharacterized protein n=1 Tax=Alteromonas aestuariivivens TaxID=1938339 RepID=A0A3D8M8J2_9ALTE|nr:hypothetical protein DXV75_09495 [Alteromonas aestuariivivens]
MELPCDFDVMSPNHLKLQQKPNQLVRNHSKYINIKIQQVKYTWRQKNKCHHHLRTKKVQRSREVLSLGSLAFGIPPCINSQSAGIMAVLKLISAKQV